MAKNKIKLITDKGYFLGITKNNDRVYLKKPSWDGDWYGGFGHLEYYNNSGGPTEHLHHCYWDLLIRDKKIYPKAALEKEFKTLTLDSDNLWKLCDYMQSFYVLRQTVDLFTCGNSHQTSDGIDLSDKEIAEKINHVILPKLFAEIEEIFMEAEDNE